MAKTFKTFVTVLSWVVLLVFLAVYAVMIYQTIHVSGNHPPKLSSPFVDTATALAAFVGGYIIFRFAQAQTGIGESSSNAIKPSGMGDAPAWSPFYLIMYLVVAVVCIVLWIFFTSSTPELLHAYVLGVVGLLLPALAAVQQAS